MPRVRPFTGRKIVSGLVGGVYKKPSSSYAWTIIQKAQTTNVAFPTFTPAAAHFIIFKSVMTADYPKGGGFAASAPTGFTYTTNTAATKIAYLATSSAVAYQPSASGSATTYTVAFVEATGATSADIATILTSAGY